MPIKPHILKQELVARSRLFAVEQQQIRFSNGTERTYERLLAGSHGAVMIIPLLDPQTLLLIREYGCGVGDYHLSFPKGAVDANETLAEAANRELMEEVGYGARELIHLKHLMLSPSYMAHGIDIFLARDLYEHKLPGDEPEPIEVIPLPLADWPQLLTRADFCEGRAVAGLFLARQWLLENPQM